MPRAESGRAAGRMEKREAGRGEMAGKGTRRHAARHRINPESAPVLAIRARKKPGGYPSFLNWWCWGVRTKPFKARMIANQRRAVCRLRSPRVPLGGSACRDRTRDRHNANLSRDVGPGTEPAFALRFISARSNAVCPVGTWAKMPNFDHVRMPMGIPPKYSVSQTRVE